MKSNLKGKIALITGSGKKSGIGYAISKKLASEGCHIIIADYEGEKGLDTEVKTGSMDEMTAIGELLHKEYGVKTLAANVDVAHMETIQDMVSIIREKFDRVDILCNNAF